MPNWRRICPRHRHAEAKRRQSDRGSRRRTTNRRNAGAAEDQERICRWSADYGQGDGQRGRDGAGRSINKEIVTAINGAGGTAVGLSGKDGNLIEAKKLRRTKRDEDSNIEKILDLGFVGEPRTINPQIIGSLEQSGIIR